VGGDAAAARLLLERVLTPLKSGDEPIELRTSGSLGDQAREVLSQMGMGNITPSQATDLLGAIAAVAKVVESSELEERIRALESGRGV
jgi:hypothetical protein